MSFSPFAGSTGGRFSIAETSSEFLIELSVNLNALLIWTIPLALIFSVFAAVGAGFFLFLAGFWLASIPVSYIVYRWRLRQMLRSVIAEIPALSNCDPGAGY